MDRSTYLPRLTDPVLERCIRSSGAVAITGPKGCGKRASAVMIASSSAMLDDPYDDGLLYTARSNPRSVLDGAVPRLIGEWQLAPEIWDAVRNEVDGRDSMGQFVLTSSSVPMDDGQSHPGTGRIAELRMRTMSLYESKDSSGAVSLAKLFDGTQCDRAANSSHGLKDIMSMIVRGGWPRSVGIGPEYAPDLAEGHYHAAIGLDLFRSDGKKKDIGAVDRLMRSYSRSISTLASTKSIISGIGAHEPRVSQSAAEDYIEALRRTFIIEDIPAWSPSIRSRPSIRQSPKRCLADPSLATASLGITVDGLMKDMALADRMFEAMCARDLRVYSQLIGGRVHHYCDSSGLDVDLIVQLRNGGWGAIEAETDCNRIPDAVEDLKRLKALASGSGLPEPSFMMVLIPDGYVCKNEDGIWTVPIDCLEP